MIRSKEVRYGINAETTAYRDSQQVRCGRCGYVVNKDRHARAPFHSALGMGITSSSNTYMTYPTSYVGLIGYWKLNEDSGDATDQIGTNTLTDTNTVTNSSEIPKTAFTQSRQFTTANTEYFTKATPVGLDHLDMLAISAWVRLDSAPGDMMIIAQHVGNAGFQLGYDSSNTNFYFRVQSKAGGDGTTATSGSVTTGTWYWVFAQYDGQSVYCYNNNSLITSAAVSPGGPVASNAGPLRIGQYGSDAGWSGQMCEIALWNGYLNKTDRTKIYSAEKSNDFTISGGCPFCGAYTYDGRQYNARRTR